MNLGAYKCGHFLKVFINRPFESFIQFITTLVKNHIVRIPASVTCSTICTDAHYLYNSSKLRFEAFFL